MDNDMLHNIDCPYEINNMPSTFNLAYLGDAVFELFVRTKILVESNENIALVNKHCKDISNAKTQASLYHEIKSVLTQQEYDIMKRGRNSISHSRSKNASVTEYRHATGLETLFGYLYLTQKGERLKELFEICFTCFKNLNSKEVKDND